MRIEISHLAPYFLAFTMLVGGVGLRTASAASANQLAETFIESLPDVNDYTIDRILEIRKSALESVNPGRAKDIAFTIAKFRECFSPIARKSLHNQLVTSAGEMTSDELSAMLKYDQRRASSLGLQVQAHQTLAPEDAQYLQLYIAEPANRKWAGLFRSALEKTTQSQEFSDAFKRCRLSELQTLQRLHLRTE